MQTQLVGRDHLQWQKVYIKLLCNYVYDITTVCVHRART